MTVLVTGAAGTTGSRVVAEMRCRGVAYRSATRRPRSSDQVRFDWDDSSTFADALRGVHAVYLVGPIEVVDPSHQVEAFLDEATAAQVQRVVTLSSSAVEAGAPGPGVVHRMIASAMPEWTVLRPSWFMQNFFGDHPLAHAVRHGEIVTATGDAKVAFIDAGDIAAVAATVLTDHAPHNTDYVLTGPEALSYAQAADIISRAVGHMVRHRSVDPDTLVALFTSAGLSADYATLLASLDAVIAAGAENRVTESVQRITGRRPRSLAEVVRAEGRSG